MIYFAVSDLHGCYKELREALSNAGFDAFNKDLGVGKMELKRLI